MRKKYGLELKLKRICMFAKVMKNPSAEICVRMARDCFEKNYHN